MGLSLRRPRSGLDVAFDRYPGFAKPHPGLHYDAPAGLNVVDVVAFGWGDMECVCSSLKAEAGLSGRRSIIYPLQRARSMGAPAETSVSEEWPDVQH
jgi:hypothetical protein